MDKEIEKKLKSLYEMRDYFLDIKITCEKMLNYLLGEIGRLKFNQ